MATGGFSGASEDELVTPVIAEVPFRYQGVNGVAHRRQLDSLPSWAQRVIQVRRQSPEFGWGAFQSLETVEDAVHAHRCDPGGGTVVAVHNLSGTTCTVRIEVVSGLPTSVVEISSWRANDDHQETDTVCLEPYGHRWYRCGGIHR